MKENCWSIGIDLGGSKIALAHVNQWGEVLHRCLLKTEVEGGIEAIIKQIVIAAQSLIQKSPTPPIGIGIGVAGQVEENSGVLVFGPNLKLTNVPLKELIEKSLQLPTVVLNDVRAATWGEWHFGAGVGVEDFVCLFVGTGIGSGIVSQGKLLNGFNNSAGEFGHMTIDWGRGSLYMWKFGLS